MSVSFRTSFCGLLYPGSLYTTVLSTMCTPAKGPKFTITPENVSSVSRPFKSPLMPCFTAKPVNNNPPYVAPCVTVPLTPRLDHFPGYNTNVTFRLHAGEIREFEGVFLSTLNKLVKAQGETTYRVICLVNSTVLDELTLLSN